MFGQKVKNPSPPAPSTVSAERRLSLTALARRLGHKFKDLSLALVMASPEPSPHEAPEVRVSCAGGTPQVFRLTRALQPHAFECATGPGRPVVVELDAPAWNRPGAPVDAGVLVTRLSLGAP